MAKKKISAKDLVQHIEKIAKERMAQNSLVSLTEYRRLKLKKEPHNILLIEDDESMRRAMKRIFEDDGHSVIAAADGTELTTLIDDKIIDLIILDVGLPWINGFELAELMKAHQDLKDIPLIFVSGRGLTEDVKRGFAIGADDYIKKPFDIEDMRSAVNTLLELNQ
ncbi:MAG: response regulator transcription factor [Bdellovibrionaceae bacterium]|nr:response regulator transcription factor [Pseudobdellovibrionaceae bacterium]